MNEDDLPEFAYEEVTALMEDAELEQEDEELSFALIARRNLPEDFLSETDAEGIARAVAGLTHVHLDRSRLSRLRGGANDPLLVANAMRNVTSLYLQFNRLTTTTGISADTAPNLRFLAVQGNRLEDLDGVDTLSTLMFLDASDNPPLRHLDELVASLPSSVRFLKCAGCGAATADATEYRQALVATLPALRTLDDVEVTRGERREARAAFGEDPDDTDEDDDDDEDEDADDDGGEEAEDDDGEEDACLLYTSPSPRDATLSRMPSSA